MRSLGEHQIEQSGASAQRRASAQWRVTRSDRRPQNTESGAAGQRRAFRLEGLRQPRIRSLVLSDGDEDHGPVRHVALLRGIGPMNPNMRNEKLRGVLEGLGFCNVQTVISSGNVVFDTDAGDVSALEARIEAAWPEQLGFRSTTIIRTREQMQDLVARNPFGDRADTPGTSLQVTFLKHEPDVNLELPFTAEAGDYTIVAFEDRVICSVIDLTGSRTPDLMRSLEKMLGREITTRTWKTVHRILRKLS
jgi:uncharacterized protein (DUF1697 family)